MSLPAPLPDPALHLTATPSTFSPSTSQVYPAHTPASVSPSAHAQADASLPLRNDGISGHQDHHSRSTSFPLPSSSFAPSYASTPFASRQLPPGASYAPHNAPQADPLLRPAPSLPSLSFDSKSAMNSQGDAQRPVQPGRSASTGRLGLETVNEGGSTGGTFVEGGGTGPEREGGKSQARLLPEPPRLSASTSNAGSSAATAQTFYSPAVSAPVLSASLPPFPSPAPAQQHPSSAFYTHQQRPSFTGIPGGRLAQNQRQPSPSPSPTDRSSNIPSFVPAAAFSANDRGPYPPHVSSSSLSASQGRSPSLFLNPATAQNGDESELLASPSSPSGATATATVPTPTSSMFIGDGRPGSLAFDPSLLPDGDMAGIGRNSIIRAANASGGASSTSVVGAVGRSSPPRNGSTGSGPKSPQLVGPSLAQLQASAMQAQPGGSPPSLPPSSLPPPVPSSAPPPAAQPPQQQQQPNQLPPHLIPQPEVCVECMMRDRDMADVDVTGEGVWERESDGEFREQMRWEEENPGGGGVGGEGSASGEHSGSQESSGQGVGGRARRVSGAACSRESSVGGGGGKSSTNHAAAAAGVGRKRLGRGQPLTTGNLKVLTSMNPPAAAHRWRTLQTFLAAQIHLLELERQAREAAALAAEREHARQSMLVDTSRSPALGARDRSSSLLSPSSLAAEAAAIEQEERAARGKGKNRSRSTLADETNRYSSASLFPPSSPISIHPPQPPFASSSSGSIRSYSAGDQPWLSNPLRRFSSPGFKQNDSYSGSSPPKSPAPSTSTSSARFPGFGKFARSTTDLRSLLPSGSPRSTSPARTSVGLDSLYRGEPGGGGGGGDGRRTSMWSRFRQSASASVLSFAPSGSMLDMHVGLAREQERERLHHGLGPYGYAGSYQQHSGGGGGGGAQAAYYEGYYPSYPSMSDPAVARHAEMRERDRALAKAEAERRRQMEMEAGGGAGGEKKEKKGIKGFFKKLVGSGSSGKGANRQASASAPATPGAELAYAGAGGAGGGYGLGGGADDDELAPPPPLSALVNEPRYHQRSASSSSIDSYGPYTPPLPPNAFRSSYADPGPPQVNGAGGGRPTPPDRQSILSFNSTRSNPRNGGSGPPGGGRATIVSRNSYGRPSLDSLRDPSLYPTSTSPLPRLGSPEPVVTIVDPNQGEPEVLVDNDVGASEAVVSSPLPFDAPAAYAQHQPRLQKSLPSLPSEAMLHGRPMSNGFQLHQQQQFALPSQQQHPFLQHDAYPSHPHPSSSPYSNYAGSRSAYSLTNGGADFLPSPPPDEKDRSATLDGSGAGGKKGRKTRPKVFSMHFGSFGKNNNKSKSNLRRDSDSPEIDEGHFETARMGDALPPTPMAVPVSLGVQGRGNSLDSGMQLSGAGGGYSGAGGYEARAMSTSSSHKAAGNAAFASKDWSTALSEYSRAIELEKDDTALGALLSSRSATYMQLGDRAALTDAICAIVLRPEWSKAQSRAAEVYARLQDYPNAEARCRRAIDLAEDTATKERYNTALATTLAANLKLRSSVRDQKLIVGNE
ncbi:hypothetical protein JCM8547_007422 [Rhodosporidiobolus lusitaniae]